MSGSAGTWWGGQWRGHRHSRRPVSQRRHWVGLTLLFLIVICFATYRYLTHEARLCRYAERWLEEFSGGEAVVETVRLDLFNGLHLNEVTLAAPESAHFDPNGNSLAARTVFHSDTLFLRLRPLSMISGNLIVPEIVAVNPELSLVHRMSDDTGNWEVMLRGRKRAAASGGWRLPVIRLRNIRVGQYRLDDRGRSGGAPQILYVNAQPKHDEPEVYDLKMAKIMASDQSDELTGEAGRLAINMRTLAVSGSLPSLSLDEMLFSAPAQVVKWLDLLDLRGYVRADTFQFDPKTGGQAVLALRDAAVSIPISTADGQIVPEQRYLRFEGMAGTIRFDGERAIVELDGRFHASPVVVKGELLLPEQPWAMGLDGIGFDVELTASDVPMPRNDADSDTSEARFVQRWKRLRDFVEDYDAIGPVDLTMRLRKLPGADQGVEFVEGTLVPKGVSGAYHRFPYRVYDLGGAVRFRPDGSIDLEDLGGTRGDGRVVVNGKVGGFSRRTEARLEIVGNNIVLDEDFRRCLSDKDQTLWKRFNLAGRVNLRVDMYRPPAAEGQREGRWKNVIEVQFLDGSACFDTFPYALSGLTGSMRIAGGVFKIDDLQGSRGETVVRMRGVAKRSDEGRASIDLELKAADLPLDDVLADALPADVRQTYQRFCPSGKADLTGRLFARPPSDQMEYDLSVSVSGGGVSVPGRSLRLESVNAKLRLVPGRLEVKSLRGEYEGAMVSLDGRVSLTPGDRGMSLHLRVDKLPLKTALRDALPATLQSVWDSFQPNGQIGLDLCYERSAPTSQPVGDVKPVIDYTAVIEPHGCSATFSGFPLPVANVSGRMVVTPQGVDIERITADHGATAFELSGHVTFQPDSKQVKLAVHAQDLVFSEALRKAVPWRLRRMWNDVKPGGAVDLFLSELEFTIKPGALSPWRFKGRMKLNNGTLVLGPKLTGVTGEIQAEGRAGRQFSISGDAVLSQARVDGRLVTDLTMKINRPVGDPVFRITDLVGDFYGGKIIGQVEVDYSAGGPRYGLSLTTRGVSLQQFLDAQRAPDKKSIKLKGRVDGNLALTGRLGDVASRRGGGKVLIREAQMLKAPLILAILQVVHLAIDDDNTFHDAIFDFIVDGNELILEQIDLRGKALSMVGAGRVETPMQTLHLVLLIGSPLRLPRLEVLSELMEGVARELVEVHVEGTLDKPRFRAEIVRSLGKTLETILNARRSERER